MWQIRLIGCQSPKSVGCHTLNHQGYDDPVSGRHRSGGPLLSPVVSMRAALCLNRYLRITQMYTMFSLYPRKRSCKQWSMWYSDPSLSGQNRICRCTWVYMYMLMYVCVCIEIYAHIHVIHTKSILWHICCSCDTKCTDSTAFHCQGREFYRLYCRRDARKIHKGQGNLRMFLPDYV